MHKKRLLSFLLSILIILNSLVIVKAGELTDIESVDIPYMLYDLSADKKLVANRDAEPIAIASITKLMTAYLVYEALKSGKISLNTKYTYTQEELDLYLRGSDVPLERGATVTVDELMHLLLIRSANSSALALSKVVAGTEEKFVNMMNEKSKVLGMKNTHFINCHGLPILSTDEQNMSTIDDLNILVKNIFEKFPQITDITSLASYNIDRYGIKTVNTNTLLGLGTVDGLKTGTTTKAGRCLISTATEAMEGMEGKRRIVSYVFGATNDKERTNISAHLINYGLDNYVYKKVLTANETYKIDLDTINFKYDKVLLKPSGTIEALLNTNETYNLKIEYKDVGVEAINKGDILGTAKLLIDGKLIEQVNLVANHDVERNNWFMRFWLKVKAKF